jgi:mRNA export factor
MVRFWEVKDNRGEARAGSYHTAPVLSTTFSGDGNMVFSGDCNKQVICWDLVSNKSNPMENGAALVSHAFVVVCCFVFL